LEKHSRSKLPRQPRGQPPAPDRKVQQVSRQRRQYIPRSPAAPGLQDDASASSYIDTQKAYEAARAEMEQSGELPNEGAGDVSRYFKDEQLKTEPNAAYFWSGNSNGIGGKDFAMDHAAKNGGTTLEGLMKSQGIEMPTWDIADQSSIKAWEYASGKYAGQVSGDIHALIGTTQRQNSIWRSIELPELMKNPYVSKIILVDPETLTETVIFRR